MGVPAPWPGTRVLILGFPRELIFVSHLHFSKSKFKSSHFVPAESATWTPKLILEDRNALPLALSFMYPRRAGRVLPRTEGSCLLWHDNIMFIIAGRREIKLYFHLCVCVCVYGCVWERYRNEMVLSALLKQCLHSKKNNIDKALSKHLKAMGVQITSPFDFKCGTFCWGKAWGLWVLFGNEGNEQHTFICIILIILFYII